MKNTMTSELIRDKFESLALENRRRNTSDTLPAFRDFYNKQWLSKDFHEEQMALRDAESRKATLAHVDKCIDDIFKRWKTDEITCGCKECYAVKEGLILRDALKQKLNEGGSQ